ncbi:MAG: MqnA/MqnD/SBP family protein [Eubacteriales bacterium]
MKKLLIIIVAAVLALSACTAANTPQPTEEVTSAPSQEPTAEPAAEPVEISVMIPFGSPALSMAGLLINEQSQTGEYSLGENVSYKTEIVNGADPLVAAFTSQSHDVIIAPTNLGAKFYNMGMPYIYAGSVVYGNLYLASTGTLDSLADLEDKEIVAFSQNSTPDVVLLTVLKYAGIENANIRYVGSVAEAQGELLAGTADAALLAEPILSVTKTKAQINIIDLQQQWSELTGAQSYPQAGIYIKSEIAENYPDIVSAFLDIVKTSVDEANNSPAQTATDLEAMEFGLPAKIIESAIPNSHLVFETAQESRKDLEFYFEKIMELNPALVGGQLPDDGFYN